MKKFAENSSKCPSCNEKMYFTRRERLYFHWQGLVDKAMDVITHYMCPFCKGTFDRWNGEYVTDAESTDDNI